MELPAYSVFSLGDSAVTINFGDVIDRALNGRVLALCERIKDATIREITDIVPAYCSLTVHYDVIAVLKKNPGQPASETIKNKLQILLSEAFEVGEDICTKHRIPVCYSLKYGWDLDNIAALVNLPVEEIIIRHTLKKYRVYMVGFLPGFAYMGEVDDQIVVPRKPEPRVNIEPGYVGIAGKQTGIYPLTSPGGWQIIGRTPVKIFDKCKEEPVLFKAGDEVEFYSITEDEFDNY